MRSERARHEADRSTENPDEESRPHATGFPKPLVHRQHQRAALPSATASQISAISRWSQNRDLDFSRTRDHAGRQLHREFRRADNGRTQRRRIHQHL